MQNDKTVPMQNNPWAVCDYFLDKSLYTVEGYIYTHAYLKWIHIMLTMFSHFNKNKTQF